MKAREVDPRSGYQSRQTPHEFHWAEHYMSGAIVVGRLQGNDDITVVGQGLVRRRPHLSAMAGRVI